jgi:hypothetical protein
MRPTFFAATFFLSFLFSFAAAAQGSCAQCRRDALGEVGRCQALAETPVERSKCEGQGADLERRCAIGACWQELEARIASRCQDCRAAATSGSERCHAMPAGSEAQVACATRAGDMLVACEARYCRTP